MLVPLTLEDADGSKPVFQQFRQALQTSSANAQEEVPEDAKANQGKRPAARRCSKALTLV
jgi:hypothetical protein